MQGRNSVEELQQDDGERLGDVLVAAFQLAASQLNRIEKTRAPDTNTHLLLRGCNQVADVLWAVGVEDGVQHFLWRELCRHWDEIAATLALEILLLRVQLECAKVPSTEADKTLQSVAFAYAQFPVALNEFWLDQVATLVSILADEGPACLFTPRMLLQLQLLDHLAAVCFLDDSDELDLSQWLDEYFPECFECCSVVLHRLREQTDDEKNDDAVGVIRMLDMCLLVFKTVVDYFETRRDDICTLLKILGSTIIVALSQVASRLTKFDEATAGEIFKARCLETSLYLLAKMVVIEEDECDALIKIFERLLAPSTASGFNVWRPTLLSVCFDAVHQIIVHSNVSDIMGPPLTALLQLSDFNILHAQYLSRKVCSTGSSEATCNYACSCFTRNQLCGENGTLTGNPESVASLLSGMDLEDPIKFVQSPAEVFVAPVSDQPCASVLKPDALQWFDDEDAGDSELEIDHPLTDVDECGSSQNKCRTSTTSIPQWFDGDDEEEEGPGIELPQLQDNSDDPELRVLLAPPTSLEINTCALDHVVNVDVASDDGSTSTEIVSWSDCSRSERSRSSSLASLPS